MTKKNITYKPCFHFTLTDIVFPKNKALKMLSTYQRYILYNVFSYGIKKTVLECRISKSYIFKLCKKFRALHDSLNL
jgi:hypothetical protein